MVDSVGIGTTVAMVELPRMVAGTPSAGTVTVTVPEQAQLVSCRASSSKNSAEAAWSA